MEKQAETGLGRITSFASSFHRVMRIALLFFHKEELKLALVKNESVKILVQIALRCSAEVRGRGPPGLYQSRLQVSFFLGGGAANTTE